MRTATVSLDLQFHRPDYSFRPAETPKQKGGPLKTQEKAFLDWLSRGVALAWQQSGAFIPGINSTPLIETAVNSLIRSNPARLEILYVWGLITREDAEALLSRTQFSPERITRMLMWTIAEHLDRWQPSTSQLLMAIKTLLPHPFIQYLAEKNKDQNVSFADAWRFAVHNPANSEEALIANNFRRPR